MEICIAHNQINKIFLGAKVSKNNNSVENSLALISRDYEKSNDLINGVGQANTLVHKLSIVCISQAKEENDGTLVATIQGQWLKIIFEKNNSNSFYDNVKAVLHKRADKQSLLDYYLLVYDDEEKKVKGINVVDTADFQNGTLKVYFTKGIKPYIWNLQNNYTKLMQQIMHKREQQTQEQEMAQQILEQQEMMEMFMMQTIK